MQKRTSMNSSKRQTTKKLEQHSPTMRPQRGIPAHVRPSDAAKSARVSSRSKTRQAPMPDDHARKCGSRSDNSDTQPYASGAVKHASDTTSCPRCASDAVYRNGIARTGGLRYRCLSCGRQFTASNRMRTQARPFCPACNSPMYHYKTLADITQFRCSHYPRCRTYQNMELVS
jgi:predicted RNA-binding Zn-ribbon protein involved in translation (DUF1610 family)